MEIVGRAPELAGLLCEAVICQGFANKGKLVANASVVHLCFAGVWHRLILDCGVIIWRPSAAQPEPSVIDSEGWEYPLFDVGSIAGVIGHLLEDYRMATTAAGCQVMFLFDNGRKITINNENDLSAFQID
jgi:hypothetical protein